MDLDLDRGVEVLSSPENAYLRAEDFRRLLRPCAIGEAWPALYITQVFLHGRQILVIALIIARECWVEFCKGGDPSLIATQPTCRRIQAGSMH